MTNVVRDEQGVRITIDPADNALVGSQAIMRYLGIDSIVTLYTYVEMYGFPAIKRPDGMWMSTITAIDTWIFLAADEDLRTREKSRGSYRPHAKQIAHIEKMFGKDSPQAEFMRRSHGPDAPKGRKAKYPGRWTKDGPGYNGPDAVLDRALHPFTAAEGRPSIAGKGKGGMLDSKGKW